MKSLEFLEYPGVLQLRKSVKYHALSAPKQFPTRYLSRYELLLNPIASQSPFNLSLEVLPLIIFSPNDHPQNYRKVIGVQAIDSQ